MVSFWWSRGDALANHFLGQILTRAGCAEVDIADPLSITRALRSAVTDPAVLAELDEWWHMVESRRSGNSTPNPTLGLAKSIRYLIDRLDPGPITAERLAECRHQVSMVDQLVAAAKNLPELQHPDAEMLGLLTRYMEVRSRVLALA